ncbi:hypothetical protein Peur_032367 [Populus x canadensis]
MAAAAWHLASSPSRDVIVMRSSLRLRQSKAAIILCKRPFYKEFSINRNNYNMSRATQSASSAGIDHGQQKQFWYINDETKYGQGGDLTGLENIAPLELSLVQDLSK